MTVMMVLSQMYIFYFCVLLFEAEIESWILSNFIPSQYPQLVHTSIDYPLTDYPFDNISSFFHHQITNPTHRDRWWLRTNADTQANIDSAYRSDALLILLLIPDQLSVAWEKSRPLQASFRFISSDDRKKGTNACIGSTSLSSVQLFCNTVVLEKHGSISIGTDWSWRRTVPRVWTMWNNLATGTWFQFQSLAILTGQSIYNQGRHVERREDVHNIQITS